MYPPHLPPPTCNLQHHHQWQRLKIIGVATFFGILGGLTGAAITMALVWPNNNVTTAIVARIPRSGDSVLSDRVMRQLNDTTFRVYRKIASANGIHYAAPDDQVAVAAVGISSGWLVMLPGNEAVTAAWRVLGPDGTMYSVGRSLNDPATGLLYLRIVPSQNTTTANEQFKVSQFISAPTVPNTVFVYQSGYWVAASVRAVAPTTAVAAHSDVTSVNRLVLDGIFPNGSPVADVDGVIVGFISNGTTVVPAFSVVPMLTGIDSRTTLQHPSIGVEGWYSEEWPVLVGNDQVQGFVIIRTTGKTPLKKGDIITEVNGHPMTFATWWALRNDSELTVEVLRQQTTQTLTITR